MPEQFDYKIAAVNVSDTVEKQIADTAESRLTREKSEQKGLRGVFTRLKDGLTLEYRRHKERNKVREEMQQSGDLYADGRSADADRTEGAKKAVLERFLSDADADMIETARGENREVLNNPEFEPLVQQVRQDIIDFVHQDFANADEEREALERMQRDLVEGGFAKGNQQDREFMLHYASNLAEIATNVRAQFRHEDGTVNAADLQKINIELIRGTQKQAVRTELQARTFDKVLSKAKSIPVLGQLLETSAGLAGYAIAYQGAKSLMTGASRATLGLTGIAGGLLVGGTLAAIRAGHEIKIKRVDTMRQLAQGKEVGPDSPEREKFAAVSYELLRASDATEGLRQSLAALTRDESGAVVPDANFEAALIRLTELEARLKLSQQRKIDLIGYSSAETAELENTELYKARAEAKIALRGAYDEGAYKAGLKERMDQLVGSKDAEGSIEAKDAQFSAMRRKRMLQAASFAGVGAMLLGTLGQEVQAQFSDKLTGAFEVGNAKSGSADTLLGGIRRLLDGTVESLKTHTDTVPGTNVPLTLPEGVDVLLQNRSIDGGPTLFSLRGPDGTMLAHNLKVDASGQLSPDSLKVLQEAVGFDVHQYSLAGSAGATQPHTSSIEEAIAHGKKNGAGEFDLQRLARRGWADNNTVGRYDHAELGQYHRTSNGDLVLQQNLNMRSFHGSENYYLAQAAQEGKLSVFISPDRANNHWGWEFKLDQSGNIIIPKGHPAHELFTIDENGKPVFQGGFVETVYHKVPGDNSRLDEYIAKGAMQPSQKGPEGIIVSTVVGKDTVDTLTFPGEDPQYGYNLIPPHQPVDIVPPVPIFTPQGERQPEKMQRPVVEKIPPSENREIVSVPRVPREPVEGGYTWYNYSGRFEVPEDRRARYSERLRENPDAKLNERQEISDYFSRQDQPWKETVESLAASIEPMDSACEASVLIPVAGHQEQKNIYKSLEWYARQKDRDGADLAPEKFEVCLLVNYPEGQNADETMQEIARFKADFPELRLRVIQKELPPEEQRIGAIRKYLSDVTLKRQLDRGEGVPELVMISNDADNLGVVPQYISNFLNRFETAKKDGKNLDGILGKIDWDHRAFLQDPALHMGTRIMQYLDAAMRWNKGDNGPSVPTSGANFAYKASIYAAVDGYDLSASICEDRDLGMYMKDARKAERFTSLHDYPIGYGAAGSQLYTSARRAIQAVNVGVAPAQMWNYNLPFTANDELRVNEPTLEQYAITSPEQMDDPRWQRHFKSDLEHYVNETGKAYGMSVSSPEFISALRFMSFEYRIENDRVIIENVSELVEGLKYYQENAQRVYERKLGVS